jgi:ubiquinone/menaquinone biosynthesis C-methylase UbiE
MDIRRRSYQPELLDQPNVPFDDIQQNMKELNVINTYLGGHKITLTGLKKLIGDSKEITICEIGCGGADNLVAIRNWCKRKKIMAKFIGIDINPDCTQIAAGKFSTTEAIFYSADYQSVRFEKQRPDIIFSSLFCHHFSDEQLILMLQWMRAQAKQGFFINDLHRSRLAYYSIKMLTRIFSKSYLVKNDAPLSVLRGFHKSEWLRLLASAGITKALISWKWAFRWLVTVDLTKC